MVKSNSYYFVVDKTYGDSHSFVDGMLIKYIVPGSDKAFVYYAKNKDFDNCNSEKKSYAIESIYSRAGVEKIFFSFASLVSYFKLFKLTKCNVFIRNEPLVLFLFVIAKFFLRDRVYLIFQNSFPHEVGVLSKPTLRERIAKKLMALSLSSVDEVFLVSNDAIERIRSYKLKTSCKVKVIPLCSDFNISYSGFCKNYLEKKFVYSGTFSSSRQLDVVIKAFYKLSLLLDNKIDWVLDFYGGTQKQFFDNYPNVHAELNFLLSSNKLRFHGKVNREQLESLLEGYDIGINLIPPLAIYKESSSTKLGEYLSKGLPVLSSNGIPYHEKVHSLSNVGWLCAFHEENIFTSLREILSLDNFTLNKMSSNSKEVALENLGYEKYLEVFYE